MVSVADLRRAFRDIEDAAPSTDSPQTRPATSETRSTLRCPPGTASDSQAATTVLFVGCVGSAGASTTALAVATVLGSARVVECCPVTVSGLCWASSAELGAVGKGWLRGHRDGVVVERRADQIERPEDLPQPAPAPTEVDWTLLDYPAGIGALVRAEGWLGDLARTTPTVVAVTRPTVPGMRRLESVIELLGESRCLPVLVGAEKRWPKPAVQAMGPQTRALHAEHRLVALPFVLSLAVHGLTPEPLPSLLLAAASQLVTLLKGRL